LAWTAIVRRLESHFLRRVEEIDDVRSQVVHSPGQAGMNRWNEIQAIASSANTARPSRICTIRGILFNMGRIILLSGERLIVTSLIVFIEKKLVTSITAGTKKAIPAIFGLRGV